MADQFNISRERLATFIKDDDTIRRFEKLFRTVYQDDQQDLTIIFSRLQELLIDSSTALGKAVANEDMISSLARLLEVAASDPQFAFPRSFPLDYMDFCLAPAYSPEVGRVGWNPTDDTVNIEHTGGVTQQVGLETYGRFTNTTASTILNGKAVGLAYSGGVTTDQVVPYIADGSVPLLNIIGITTQSVAVGSSGRITVWGRVRQLDTTGTPYGEVWAQGDTLYASPLAAGALTNVKPTAPAACIPLAVVIVLGSTDGEIFVRPSIDQSLYYGSFVKTTSQIPSAINTAQLITWSSSPIANGVVRSGTVFSRIIVEHSGLYQFNASFQMASSSASVKNVWLWFRKNGVDVANSSRIISLDSATAIKTISISQFFSLAANDYMEMVFASDSTNMTLNTTAATAFAPATPAGILTVTQEQQ